MLHWLGYLVLAYFAVGAVIYVYGHPKTFLKLKKRAFREKEAGVVQSSYNITVNHDLAAGSNLPAQGLSEGDNKGSQ